MDTKNHPVRSVYLRHGNNIAVSDKTLESNANLLEFLAKTENKTNTSIFNYRLLPRSYHVHWWHLERHLDKNCLIFQRKIQPDIQVRMSRP